MLQELEHDYEDADIGDEADYKGFGVTKYLTLTSDLSNIEDFNAQPVPTTQVHTVFGVIKDA